MNPTRNQSRPLWHWAELCEALGLASIEGPEINQISIDSRQASEGDLFVALSGDPGPGFHSSGSSGRDGHDFINAAVESGVAGILVSRDVSDIVAIPPVLQTENTLTALWDLGRYARRRMEGRVVGITGSSGKTTARQWVEELLSSQSLTHASTGSFNNHWGVPLSLARMPLQSEFGVFEIGMNNPGEIAPLAKLVQMDVAVVLNVLPAHLGRFSGLAQIRDEKLSISEGLRPGGILVLPIELKDCAPAGVSVLTFGLSAESDIYGQPVYSADGAIVQLKIGEGSWQYRLSVGGEHRVLTSLACLAVLHALNLPVSDMLDCFPGLTTPNGRGNREDLGTCKIINDCYNANPVSMVYALEELAQAGEGVRKIAIIGEMLELGDFGPQLHRDLVASCEGLDAVITVGEGFFDTGFDRLGDRFLGHYASSDEVDLQILSEHIGDHAVVLVKGSNRVFWVTGFVEKLRKALASQV